MRAALLLIPVAAFLISTTVACETRRIEPEVLIPEGMPVTLDVWLDKSEREETKFHIRHHAGPEVDFVTLILLTVGQDNKVDSDSRQLVEAMTARESDLASTAWPKTEDVRRLIVIVKRVDTSSGEWVLDSEDQNADLQAIVERGRDALPKAKFIRKS